jgi:hypothetical protein
MGRVRATAAVCAVGLGVIAGSCSGDGGEQVLRTDGDTAPVAFEAAIRETFTGTGRYTFTMDDDDAGDVSETGEFSGDTVQGSVTWEDEDPMTMLVAGDVTYARIDDTTDDSLDGFPIEMLQGKEWLRITPTPEEVDRDDTGMLIASSSLMALGTSAGGNGASAPQILSQLDRILSRAQDVRPDGSVDLGGTPYDRFQVRLDGSEIFELWGVDAEEAITSIAKMYSFGPEGPDSAEPDEARVREVVDYTKDHLNLELTVVARDKDVRRVDIRVVDTIEDQYSDCMLLDTTGGPDRMTFEFSDLGTPIDIAAPDPATTVSYWDMAEQFDPSESFDEGGGPDQTDEYIQASDGEWTRDEIEEFVIADAARLGVDPVSVPSLPEDQLVALYERSLTLDGPLLETEWDGQVSRTDAVAFVIAGADTIGLDPRTVPTMPDLELVAAYDKISEQRYGPSEDDDQDDWTPPDVFEGCPG